MPYKFYPKYMHKLTCYMVYMMFTDLHCVYIVYAIYTYYLTNCYTIYIIRHVHVYTTGDAREVHDFATLLGFGADGVCPYMAYEALSHMNSEGVIQARAKQSFTDEELFYSYRKSAAKGMYIAYTTLLLFVGMLYVYYIYMYIYYTYFFINDITIINYKIHYNIYICMHVYNML